MYKLAIGIRLTSRHFFRVTSMRLKTVWQTDDKVVEPNFRIDKKAIVQLKFNLRQIIFMSIV